MAGTTVTKRCWGCKETKPASAFYRQKKSKDGLQGECKDCERARSKTPEGMARRRRAAKKYIHTDNGSTKHRAYAATAKAKEWHEQWRRTNVYRTDKSRARGVIASAVYDGRIPSARTLKCVRCGGQAEHYHHHLGYAPANQHDVVPVCAMCHKAVEGQGAMQH